MAVVKMSKTLKEEILSNAKKIFDSQETTLGAEVDALVTPSLAVRLLFEHNEWGITREIHDDLKVLADKHTLAPGKSGLFYPVKSVKLELKLKQLDPSDPGKPFAWGTIDVNKPISGNTVIWPPARMNWDKKTTDSIPVTLLFDTEDNVLGSAFTDPVYHHLIDKCKRLMSKRKERKQFLDLVRNTLAATNSLRQFLKAWPEGQSLVPDSYLNELNRKTGRNKAEVNEVLDEESRRKLSGTLLINKMQSSD